MQVRRKDEQIPGVSLRFQHGQQAIVELMLLHCALHLLSRHHNKEHQEELGFLQSNDHSFLVLIL